ncbi:MAG: VCBS repeat-containing protein, partial [Pirellulales bacterium]|nr:VCBS repeat-containing protein [Pirellulales bacterium]
MALRARCAVPRVRRPLRFEHLEDRRLLSIAAPGQTVAGPALQTALDTFYWADGRQIPLLVARDAEANKASPVFVNAETGARMTVGDEVVVALQPGVDPRDVLGEGFAGYRRLLGTLDQYVATVTAATAEATIAQANQLHGLPEVVWAVPNFCHEFRSTTDDPLFEAQWHLHNTGQTGAREDADADLPEAWARATGGHSVVIAVLDDGVQTDHPDLPVFGNTAEIPDNGIDDDHNGWIDDICGWDFRQGDNDPNPATEFDNHGTAVAGVAAAVGNNALGVSGAAPAAEILPIKIARDDGGDDRGYADAATIAEAIYYAAGRTADGLGTWRGADVMVVSWAGGSPDPVLNEAFDWAATSGRGGLGTAAFCAAGNEASGYQTHACQIPAGDWVFQWRYEKDASGNFGSDTAWLADVRLPDGTVERFDAPVLPPGWSTSGDAAWSVVDDPAYGYGVGRYAARAGTIGDDQVTTLQSPAVTVDQAGLLSFEAWVSSEADFDRFSLYLSADGGNTFVGPLISDSGVPRVRSNVAYPAALPGTIAVGASTDWDYRADYSQYGGALDFVAPSGGGSAAITTTDRTGQHGYHPLGDTTSAFTGTSAAAPLAAGVGALLLADHPQMTAAQLRQVLSDSTDQIGDVTYSAGFNLFYGHGRINAARAMATRPDPVVIRATDGSHAVAEGRTGDAYWIVLGSPPTDEVTIRLLNEDGQLSTGGPLVFTPERWNVPQLAEVGAVDDPHVEDLVHAGVIRHAVSSNDPTYDSIHVPDVIFTITDNDDPATPATVGDRVWHDLDADGIQDPGEPGVFGVEVALYYAADDTLVAVQTTDASGRYRFEGLTPGDHYLQFPVPEGFTYSLPAQGGDETLDSDADAVTGRTAVFTLPVSHDDPTRDAGLVYLPASIRGRQFYDVDGDGRRDAGEPALDGGKIKLLHRNGQLLTTATTARVDLDGNDQIDPEAESGLYAFENLVPGTYYIEQEIAADWVQSLPGGQEGSAPGYMIALASGQEESGRDFGTYPLPEIEGVVWHDLDGNGIRDAAEPGRAATDVALYLAGGALVATTATDGQGRYRFEDVSPGDYYLKFTPPAGCLLGLPGQGDDETSDSDAHPWTGMTEVFTLFVTANGPGPDAAVTCRPATLESRAFHDLDEDGTWDAAESGVPGLDVELVYAGEDGAWGGDDDVSVATQAADGCGTCTFADLPPGDYYLRRPTLAGVGFSSGVDPITTRSPVFRLAAGQRLTHDTGLTYEPCTVRGQQFDDRNGNGSRDPDEPGIDGWTIELRHPGGQLLATAVTAAIDLDGNGQTDPATESGWYWFAGLPTGIYRVEQRMPDGWQQSRPVVPAPGYTVQLDSSGGLSGAFAPPQQIADVVEATSVCVADLDGDGDLDVLAASYSADRITWCENLDGAGTFGPPRLVTAVAYGANAVHAADLDGDGDLDVLSAAYYGNGIAWYENTDGEGHFGRQQVVSAALGAQAVTTADLDGDGDLDVLSAAYGNGVVWCENSAGDGSAWTSHAVATDVLAARSVCTADLDGDGDLDVLSASAGDGKLAWYANTDARGTFGPQRVITATAAEALSVCAADLDGDGDADVLSASFRDDTIAWYENTDSHGAFGSPRVMTRAADGATSAAAADLDGDGDLDVLSASFRDGAVAWYENTDRRGAFGAPQVIVAGADGANAVVAADLDADGDLDVLSTAYYAGQIAWCENTVSSGRRFDFANYRLPSVGDLVWHDQNGNGVRDPGEPGRAGAGVELFYAGDDGRIGGGDDVSLATAVTGPNGGYRFDGLSPGGYYLEFTPPDGFFLGLQDRGSDDTRDSDPNPMTGRTDVFQLTIGAEDLSRDAGVTTELASFGGRVFQDLDDDGIRDAGEPGVLGVGVALWWAGADAAPGGGDDAPLGACLTDTDGSYRFIDLRPGAYYVQLPVLPGVPFSPQDQGDDTCDSDVDPGTGRTPAFTLGPGPDNPSPDAGVVFLPTVIEGRQFHDVDGDGVHESDEPLLDGATVTLRHADGRLLTTTTTASGLYRFEHLWPGTYLVGQELPADWVQSLPAEPIVAHRVTLSNGSEAVGLPQAIDTRADGAWSVFAADLDGDGDDDVLSASAGSDTIAWYENLDSRGTFAERTVITDQAAGARSVFAADFDSDGDLDVLAASSEDDTIAWHENVDGHGGSWADHPITRKAYGAVSVFAGDFDGDGDSDVLAASAEDNTVAWYENLAGGGTSWVRHVITLNAQSVQSVFAADLDGDGDQDVLSASAGDGKIAWYENVDSHGSFGARPPISVEAEWATAVYAADLDGDGDQDVVSASAQDDMIAWYENVDSRGAFGPQRTITTAAEWATSVCAADLDGDGDQDVLSASAYDNAIAWYENTDWRGTFGPPRTITAAADQARAVFAADLNGDGRPDVLAASAGDGRVAWYENGDGPLQTQCDFGRYPLPAVGDRVWHDQDGDGIQDAGEPGVAGVQVTLWSAGDDGAVGGGDDQTVATAPTDAAGHYGFEHLPPGQYYLEFVPPGGFVLGLQDRGDDDSRDSDTHPITGLTSVFTLSPGPDDTSRDAAVTSAAAVAGRAFHDLDADGVQDPGEPGALGADIELVYAGTDGLFGGGDDVPVDARISDVAGNYRFADLSPGDYYLRLLLPGSTAISPQDQGNDAVDSDVDPATGRTPVFTLAAHETAAADAGLVYQPASILGRVFHDVNGNGIQDFATASEPGLGGRTISLLRADGHALTATATVSFDLDGNGQIDPATETGLYGFADLLPGTYRVEQQLPAGWVQSLPGPAAPGHTLTLSAGQIASGRDFGAYQLHAIGDWVFHDRNGNGIQDEGERGLEGIQVSLFSDAGVLQAYVITDSDGGYRFAGLPVGDYYLEFSRPSGFAFSPPHQADAARDSDVHPYTHRTEVFSLAQGTDDLSRDAGLIGSEPAFGYAVGAGSEGIDEGRAVAIDAAGNVLTAGRFTGMVDFDPGPATMNLISSGQDDVFVAKYSPAGALLWVRAMGGLGSDVATGVVVDDQLDVYLTGSFSGVVDFNPGLDRVELAAEGGTDAFVVKLDRRGEFVWARSLGGPGSDAAMAIGVDDSGSIYTAGRFSDTADFDPGPATVRRTSAGDWDAFVCRLDPGGDFVWARTIGGSGPDQVTALAVDDAGRVHLAGEFSGVADLEPGTGIDLRSSAGGSDVFVAALSPEGIVTRAETFGGANDEVAGDIAVDALGNRYVAGAFEGTIPFSSGGAAKALTSAGGRDALLVRFDASGNVVWARSVGSPGPDRAHGVALDNRGGVYLAGSFQQTVDFDPGPGIFRQTSTGGDDLFVLKLDAAGLFCFAQSVGGTNGAGDERAFDVAADPAGGLAITGAFASAEVDLDPTDGQAPFRNQGNPDIVVMELEIGGRVKGSVWNDLDQHLDFDGNEPRVSEVTVELYDPGPDGEIGGDGIYADELMGTTDTNEHGSYYFFDVPHPQYYLKFNTPNGFYFISDEGDSDVDPSTGLTELAWVGDELDPAGTLQDLDAGVNSLSKPAAPEVASRSLQPYGVTVQFTRWIESGMINLVDFIDSPGGTLGPADFVLTGSDGKSVPGSLIVGEAGVTFVPTGGLLRPNDFTTTGLLPPDVYVLKLRSAEDGFRGLDWRDPWGVIHPGDPLAGGDYLDQKPVAWSDPAVISLPDFTCAPGQPIDVPTDVTDAGLPILLHNPEGRLVETVEVAILYDPHLLTFAKDAAYVPPGGTVALTQTSEGVILVKVTAPAGQPFSGQEIVLACLSARVPDGAEYGAAAVLTTSAWINRNEYDPYSGFHPMADDAVEVVAQLGDTTRDGQLRREDAQHALDVAVGLDAGLAAYPLLDPVLVADLAGNGRLGALDAARILQQAVGMAAPEGAPRGEPCLVEIPNDLRAAAGDSVVVPIAIDDAETVESFYLEIDYDPAVLIFVRAALGDLVSPRDPVWAVNDTQPGRLILGVANPAALPVGGGCLLQLEFLVQAAAPPGQSTPLHWRQVQLSDGALSVVSSDGQVTVGGVSTVVERHVFYNHSVFDGRSAAADVRDDQAIAPDKEALLPGGTATFANYTSYSRGINGIMIDVAGLPDGAVPGTSDFRFRMGNNNDPDTWAEAPAPAEIVLREGAGTAGSDRLTLVWNDYAVSKQWLQVVVLPTATTGLSAADVFYFGNAVADGGNSTVDARVNATDMLLARNNPRTFINPAPLDFRYDYDRDARVNASDLLLARNNTTSFLTALRLITVPGVKGVQDQNDFGAHGIASAAGAPSAADPKRTITSSIDRDAVWERAAGRDSPPCPDSP